MANDEFFVLTDKYFEAFGRSYGVVNGDTRPLEVHIEIMKKCLAEGRPYEQNVFEGVREK